MNVALHSGNQQLQFDGIGVQPSNCWICELACKVCLQLHPVLNTVNRTGSLINIVFVQL